MTKPPYGWIRLTVEGRLVPVNSARIASIDAAEQGSIIWLDGRSIAVRETVDEMFLLATSYHN